MHPVRLRKRLDPQSLIAAERHPVTGRLAPHGRRDKARNAPKASLARTGGIAGLLAAGALVTAAAGGAAATVKAGTTSGRPHPAPMPRAEQATEPSSGPTGAPVVTIPSPCQLVSQAVAQRAVGVPVETSEDKPTSCLYAGTAPSPFRSLEIRYDRGFDPNHIRRTLSAAHVTARPVAGLPDDVFSHPAFVQTVNGTTQFSPAEVVVPFGPLAVIISSITIDENGGAGLVDAAHDEAVAIAVARAVLVPYVGR